MPDEKQLRVRLGALREQRDRAARHATIAEQTAMLDAAKVPYEILMEVGTGWLEKSFPLAGGLTSPRVDWEKVGTCVRGPAAGGDEVIERAWLEALTEEQGLADPWVVVLSQNGLHPAIRLRFVDFRKQPRIASSFGGAWVTCEADGWVIEHDMFESRWWWGRAKVALDR